MRGVPGHQNHAANARRKPLAPLPAELSGPIREFVSALRRMHGELGYSLKEMENRLPASRSSLSRYLRGQSLPDERLLVQWCKLSFTGEDRLPALVELLHRAQQANETPQAQATGAQAAAGERGGDAAGGAGEGPVPVAPGGAGPAATAAEDPAAAAPGRRRLRLALAGLGTALVLAAAAFAVTTLTGSLGDAPGASGDAAPAATNTARFTVNNVELACQHSHSPNCRLGLARDPYVPYGPSNIVGHVWHGDVLRARCRIADGVSITDEVGGHSSIWLRVEHAGGEAWMPGIRVRPEQLGNIELPVCPH
ncbi:helix-turn-helix domain-containing protein [Streptomyces pinistramenti]|uniref:helix-turn-helix domain-containing protein n=1 Tax=Streptomyces pinistramenti TaxID=2884812 RepID=UPI001D0990A6|nr:helix-turn-helix transcriptional regulator [Streptomyces pinistramenti]MCB5911350.1 helix-turn-helix transcriptional regulator [Streptomyces pinistramenti]